MINFLFISFPLCYIIYYFLVEYSVVEPTPLPITSPIISDLTGPRPLFIKLLVTLFDVVHPSTEPKIEPATDAVGSSCLIELPKYAPPPFTTVVNITPLPCVREPVPIAINVSV